MSQGSRYELESLDPVADVDLDPYNPRLSRSERGSNQEQLLDIMIRRFDVLSLGEAIVAAGFLTFDPLVGYRADSGRVRIREGNRRLAALKLLLDPELAPERYRKSWRELAERLPASTKQAIRQVEIQVWPDRDEIDLTAYIGYRHVTGVRPWPAFEKAAFIAHLVEVQRLDYREIAERIGSKPRHIERHYIAYRLVVQSDEDGIPGSDQMEDSFGVLLRSLQAKGIAEFLGIEYSGEPHAAERPVPEDKEEELAEFVRWTFGTKDQKKVLEDSRQLTKWARILSEPAALSYLRRTPEPDFERAWVRSGGETESLSEALWLAADQLREAVPIASAHAEDGDVQEAVHECARFFAQLLTHFPSIQDSTGLRTNHA